MCRVRKALLVSLAASLLVGLAACGSSTPSSEALLKDALSAFDSASSVNVTGVVPHKGGSYDVDLAMSRSGDLSGTISTSIQQIKLVIVGGTAYQYVGRDFFAQLVLLQKVPASDIAARLPTTPARGDQRRRGRGGGAGGMTRPFHSPPRPRRWRTAESAVMAAYIAAISGRVGPRSGDSLYRRSIGT